MCMYIVHSKAEKAVQFVKRKREKLKTKGHFMERSWRLYEPLVHNLENVVVATQIHKKIYVKKKKKKLVEEK